MSDVSLWDRLEPLLPTVERPSRYIDHEYNARHVDFSSDCSTAPEPVYRAALLYPDTYEIGQANQAIAILYDAIWRLEDCVAERVFLPWIDLAQLMREQGIPLFSLESCSSVAGFDFLGITLSHELAATNVLEALDLAGIPLHADERKGLTPLIVGGGPVAYNPEPIAAFFDAFVIGEGEEVISELIAVHRRCIEEGLSRSELFVQLAHIPGVYVPSLYAPDETGALLPLGQGIPSRISKRIVGNLDSWPIITDVIVPYAEVSHDRLTVEVLRGCARGCRFCQAGMTGRPVRERRVDTIVSAVSEGLACTGFDEVSLTSLSTTDHSRIEELLRRLNGVLEGTSVGISLPSQRLDAFGIDMAHLVAGQRRAGLTFAPEAGTQRLRDSINKNVSDGDVLDAVTRAFEAGWRRCKLYFMLGLPSERDEDVLGIVELANRAYAAAKEAVADDQRSKVRMSVSVSVFVPKAQTPFQWEGQPTLEEIERRVTLLRSARLHKGIDLHWHDPAASRIEAALARAGRDGSTLIEAAFRSGATFDAWSERFDATAWERAAVLAGKDLAEMAERNFEVNEPLPWGHISAGLDARWLARERARALAGETTADCSFADCSACGVCDATGASNDLAGERRG
ncbi:MAG: TIGR03960 family B12-binding radical SAM protein [Coriobacteriales bacterium]|jgi:radical SAM family uncharacterized protein|nr:TIGR03960 family B12-binding radical SAM protein [Coriobacteriales bacterium]